MAPTKCKIDWMGRGRPVRRLSVRDRVVRFDRLPHSRGNVPEPNRFVIGIFPLCFPFAIHWLLFNALGAPSNLHPTETAVDRRTCTLGQYEFEDKFILSQQM